MSSSRLIARPFSAFLVFILIWLTSTLAFTGFALLSGFLFFGKDVVSAGADALAFENGMSWLRYNQAVSQLGVFIIPSLIFSVVFYGHKAFLQGLGLKAPSSWKIIIVGIIMLLFSIPFVNLLMEWNQSLDLPSAMQGLEDWIQRQEDTARKLSEAFLEADTIPGLIMNVLIVAILPAIGEELLFRGSLQNIFIRWTGNRHWGVLIGAIAFSSLHMQFFGFLPRLWLGLLLGYAYLWTRNLWVPIAMHLVNNLLIVIITWFSNRGIMNADEEAVNNFNPYWAVVFSLVLVFSSARYLYLKKAEKV